MSVTDPSLRLLLNAADLRIADLERALAWLESDRAEQLHILLPMRAALQALKEARVIFDRSDPTSH